MLWSKGQAQILTFDKPGAFFNRRVKELSMKILPKILLTSALVISTATAGCMREIQWHVLNSKVEKLHNNGEYEKATPMAKRALEIAEATFDPNHPNVAISLNNIATVYYYQGRYAEVEPLLQRALAIVERAQGPNHLHVATVLENYGALYRKIGKTKEGEAMEMRAQEIRSAQ